MSFQNFRDPSTVHLVTASDPHHEHTQSGALDAGDDAVIAYPVLPEPAQIGTLEGLPDATRIVQRGNAAMQKGKDTPCRLLIELTQLADGGAVKLDLPGPSVP